MEKLIGYARVSMTNQDLTLQIDSLQAAGVSEKDIFIEKISGALRKEKRPEFDRCMNSLREGDTLVVWKLDRLGRSLKELISIAHHLRERNIGLMSLTETIDTSTPNGQLYFHIMSSFAEYERDLIRERTKAGLDAARKRGIRGGRKFKLSKKEQNLLIALYKSNIPVKDILMQFNISKSCFYSYLHLHKVLPKK